VSRGKQSRPCRAAVGGKKRCQKEKSSNPYSAAGGFLRVGEFLNAEPRLPGGEFGKKGGGDDRSLLSKRPSRKLKGMFPSS